MPTHRQAQEMANTALRNNRTVQEVRNHLYNLFSFYVLFANAGEALDKINCIWCNHRLSSHSPIDGTCACPNDDPLKGVCFCGRLHQSIPEDIRSKLRDSEHIAQYMLRQLTAGAAPFTLNDLAYLVRTANFKWWIDPVTGDSLVGKRNKAEMIALMHSELSECLEGVRKDLQDDKLPQFKMEHVEIVDLLIRLLDYAGDDIDLNAIFLAKMKFNLDRKDHSLEERVKPNGKKF